MNKTELAAQVAQTIKEPKARVAAWVDKAFEAMASALVEGEEVNITDFGRFKVVSRAARVGRDPRTGAKVDIPAKRVVKFKPSLGLRNRLQPSGPAKKAKEK